MITVFICHAPEDREIASGIAARLERGAEARVVPGECGGYTVETGWEGGLYSTVILLLLSPDSVPARLSRDDWESVLDHFTGNAEPPLGTVVVRSCPYPKLLERKNFFRWPDGETETLRAIERWVLSFHPLPERHSFLPARLPWFDGRQREMDALWRDLVDRPGSAVVVRGDAGSGKSAVAQEFARRAADHFREAIWIACGDRPWECILGELAVRLKASFNPREDGAVAGLAARVGQHRMLLVLDDTSGSLPFPGGSEGLASLLITTRRTGLDYPATARVIDLSEAPDAKIGMPENPLDMRLWQAMAVCRRDGFPLELAAEVASIGLSDAEAVCDRLIKRRLADPFDRAGPLFRLSAPSLAAAESSADLAPQRRRHAEVLHSRFAGRSQSPERCEAVAAEVDSAFRWASEMEWPMAVELAKRAFAFLRGRGRLAEAAHLLGELKDAAELREDEAVCDYCASEFAWIDEFPYGFSGPPTLTGEQMVLNFSSS